MQVVQPVVFVSTSDVVQDSDVTNLICGHRGGKDCESKGSNDDSGTHVVGL